MTAPPTPPVAKRVPHVHQRHAGPVEDPWHWLRNRDDPDTIAYLEAENAWADAWFGPLEPVVDEVYGEILRRTRLTDTSAPVPWGPFVYLTRTVEGLDYPVHVRRPRDGGGEQVILDENAEAAGHGYHALGAFEVSPSHRLLAWSVDRDGGERHELRIRDLTTLEDLPDRIAPTSSGAAWSADERWVFYTVPDEAMRPYQVWRHPVGTPDASADVLVLTEDDDRFNVGVATSRSGAFVVISIASHTTSEVWVIPTGDPTAPPRLVEPRTPDHEYEVAHWGDRFVIVTNLDAEDFRVVTAPVDDPGRARWTELLPHRPGTRVHGAYAFEDFLVVHEWADALPRLRIVLPDGTTRVLGFDEPVHAVAPGWNPEYRTDRYRFTYESLVTPETTIEEHVATGARTVVKVEEVLGGHDPSRYTTRREWAPAADGTLVPIDIAHRADLPLDGTAPLLLTAYGSYEVSLAPWFSIPRLSLLDRGVVFALAHPRGGGELGRRWYLDGKLRAKRNTFTDTIACVEHLVRIGVAAPDRVVVRGGSAGGLLVGACITMRPELFAGAVAEVPFVDVVTTMYDETLPLTIPEWEEWGNPNDPGDEAYLASYSPYDQTVPARYPALLVTAGLNDPRVSYHEPAKWVAKLRAVGQGDRPVLLRTELGAGHGGPSGRYDAWRDEARIIAFVLWAAGVVSR